MKNSTIVLFVLWIIFAVLDIVGLFANMPLVFGILFGILNTTVIIGAIPMFVQEFRDRKYQKWADENPAVVEDKEE